MPDNVVVYLDNYCCLFISSGNPPPLLKRAFAKHTLSPTQTGICDIEMWPSVQSENQVNKRSHFGRGGGTGTMTESRSGKH